MVVVGAGPTGLTAATLLARRGVSCLVVERHRALYPLPRAVHLDDEVLRIAQAAGAAEQVEAVCRPALGMRLVDGRLRPLLEIRRDRPVGVHGWPETNMFDQPDLERALRANLARHPDATLLTGHEVVSVRVDRTGGATVTVRDLADGAVRTVATRHVLACDGTNSALRDQIGSRMRDLGFDQHWLVVDVRSRTPLDLWPGVHQICAGTDSGTYMQIADDRYRWEFRLPGPGPVTDERVRELLAPWFPDGDAEVLRRTSYSHRAAVADVWRRGPVFLLGDAAHVTPPFIGQGLGAGQRDAMNLAWKVAAVHAGTADDALLDTYQPERRAHVTRAIRGAVLVGRVMSMPPHPAVHGVLRCAALLPDPDPIARRILAPPLRGLAPPTTIPMSRSPIGSPFPQWPLADGRRSDYLLGDGFALVGTAGVGPLSALARDVAAATVTTADLPAAAAWLSRHRLRAVLIRPDRVVVATLDRRDRFRGPSSRPLR